ncbi:unnamed protein product [Somion occarium]|uniref:Glycosyltransferase 61 catalytic domain-containing protein n=2 Tax=Somion occarium TaxID=3059160 RepID=A0ABP1DM63_9APHY
MAFTRTRTLRDAVLILLGATCMHLASNFMGTVTDKFSGDIIVNTHFNSPDSIDLLVHNFSPSQTRPDLDHEFPETTIMSHAPGWTVFENLYMSNGTLFIVSSHPPSSFPDIQYITSTGLAAENTPENIAARMPTSANMDFITPEQARDRWGPLEPEGKNRVWSVEGNTFLVNDPSQFLDHYYHFCAELLLGAWAFWSGAHDAIVEPYSPLETSAPPLHRAIFAHADVHGWRDRPGFNSYFLRSAFPSLTVEVQSDWEDRIQSTSASGMHARAWHFDKVLFTDRSAAFRGQVCGTQVQRTAAEAIHHMHREGNLTKLWWEPVRRAVLRFGGVDEDTLDVGLRADVNAMAHVKKPDGQKISSSLSARKQDVVITYISRQGARRHLVEEDHDALAQALEDMCLLKGWELNIVMAERLTKDEQVELIARTTILLGVHGNGLTHLILMSPTPISAVIEMFYPGGFAHDYEWTTRAMGMKHFAVQNDTYFTHPNLPWVGYPEGFQGTKIPVYAPTVVKIIEERVAGYLPNSELLMPINRLGD